MGMIETLRRSFFMYLMAGISTSTYLMNSIAQENKSFNISLNEGWNNISVPVEGIEKEQIPNLERGPVTWDTEEDHDVFAEVLDPKKGYFVKVNTSGSIEGSGPKPENKDVSLKEGSNLISSISGDLTKDDIEANCDVTNGPIAPNLPESVDYEDSPEADVIQPSKGYWVEVSDRCRTRPTKLEADFDYTPNSPNEQQKITLDASPTINKNLDIIDYKWDIGDDGTIDERGAVVSATLSSGDNLISLSITTERGVEDRIIKRITVSEFSLIERTFKFAPENPTTQDTVAFDASETTAEDTDIQAYEWDFDDDGTVDTTGVNAVNQFNHGRHVVTLTVRDAQGNEETTEQVLEVDPKRVNISITASDTEVEVGGKTIIQYSVNNFLSGEELTTQLLVETPSDVNVTGVSGAQGSNQYTAEATVPPGEQQSMRVTVQTNAVGQHEITAIAEYLTTGEQAIDERVSKELLITAVDGTPEEESTVSTETEDELPGFGIGSGLVAIGGAWYTLKSRMKNNNEN